MNSKLPYSGTSIFTVMSSMATEYGALNLAQGFPDFPVSEELIERIAFYMRGGFNQYAPMSGALKLRSEIARVVEETYSRKTDSSNEVTIYAGATEALFASITAITHPGDEIIVFDPAYDSYDPAIRLSGGVPVHVHLKLPDFRIDWDEVRSRITPRTRAILINSPHNPTGTVLSDADMHMLSDLVKKYDLYVISDEVYERIIFDDKIHESVLRYPELTERSIAVFSFGKTFHATGWKIGYSIASETITRELQKVHQFLTFAVNHPIQLALADYLKDPDHYQSLGAFYQGKRDLFITALQNTNFIPVACHGTYFQLVQVSSTGGLSDIEYAEKLTRENGIASIPVSVFYGDGYDSGLLRFCFAKSDETIQKAAAILKTIPK